MKILKFYSNSCGPCKVMSKELAKLKDIEIVDYDATDENNVEILDKYKVLSIPTIIVVDDKGDTISRFGGIVPIEKIKEVIK